MEYFYLAITTALVVISAHYYIMYKETLRRLNEQNKLHEELTKEQSTTLAYWMREVKQYRGMLNWFTANPTRIQSSYLTLYDSLNKTKHQLDLANAKCMRNKKTIKKLQQVISRR